jgi:ribose/xylose/arabinose/galactoside ABC-type transport system permease subunit
MSSAAKLQTHGLRRMLSYDATRVVLGILLVMVVTSIFSPYFLTLSNIGAVLRSQAIIGIMAVGVLFVMLLGGIDISIGSVFGIAGTVSSLLLAAKVPVGLCILASIACGLLVGLGNGLLIARLRMAPFIVTLGMMGIVRGVNLILTGATSLGISDPAFLAIDAGSLLFIPLPIIFLLVVFAAADVFLKRSVVGSRIYAIGGDEDAARMLGINVERTKILAYALCGVLAAVGGVIGASKVSASYPLAGSGYEFEAIAAVIVGGALMQGGKGTVLCSILGAIFIGLLKNAILQLGVSQYWQQALSGFAIIFVLIVSTRLFKGRRPGTRGDATGSGV